MWYDGQRIGLRPLSIIVNPAAGQGRAAREWPGLATALRRHQLDFRVSFTRAPGDATELARAALQAGAETVVAVGGDGTINEVVNGFFQDDQPISPNARLGIISVGSGCDLVRSLGLARGPAAVAALAGGQTRSIDLGRVEFVGASGERACRYFANVADMGLGGETAAWVNRHGKQLGGFGSFLAGAVVSILRHEPKRIEYRLDDAPSVVGRASMVVVANARYCAGGMLMAPRAVLDDGLFDVVVLTAVSKGDLIAHLLPRVYRGAHLTHPAVHWARARRVAVRSADPLPLELDGEQPGTGDAVFTVLPGALRVIT